MNSDPFIWIDLETTGLEPTQDLILELGLMVTDRNLQPLHTFSTLVKPSVPVRLCRATTDQFVMEMHDKSGLWTALQDAEARGSLLGLIHAERAALDWLRGVADDEGFVLAEQPMCGSNVPFDRGFLHQKMPLLEMAFHYRNIDISTIKEIARRRAPALFDARPTGLQKHRSISDLHDSIDEAAYYFKHFLVEDIA